MIPTRRDLLILWGVALLWLALFTSSMLYHTGGRWALPLDDSFIYLQYARQAADGQFLQYNPGAIPTAGATSLLYMLLLVPGFWLDISGVGIVVYVLFLGYVLLSLSASLMFAMGTRLGGRQSGWLCSLLFLSCGPLLWGFFSGMEIGMFSFSILLTLSLFIANDRRCPYAATMMALSRPEGIVLALLVAAMSLTRDWRDNVKWSWCWLMPFAALALQGLLINHYTGSPSASGLSAKWLFSAPHTSIPATIRVILFSFTGFMKGILAGSLGEQTSAHLYAYDGNYRRIVFAPFVALFFIAELGIRCWDEWQTRRPSVAVLAAMWFVLGILATCTLVEYDAHFNRYQQPFLPLFILFVGLGLQRLLAYKGAEGAVVKVGWGFSFFFALWGLISVSFFAVAYGENSGDIRNQQIEMAHFIDANVPSDARVAINDAGAMRYFGNRETIDLVGLTTAGNSRPWRHGSGSIFERLESMDPSRRPQYFAIFPNWFQFPGGTFLRPLHRIRIFAPSIIDAEKVLYHANWESLQDGGSFYGELPVGEWRVVDHIDVADLDSEGLHDYSSYVQYPGKGEANLLLNLSREGEVLATLMDGGRTATGGEQMSVEIDPAKPALLAMRTVTGIRQNFVVMADGVEIAEVDLPGGRGRHWLDITIAQIPAGHGGASVAIDTRPIHYGGDLRPVVSFHYWVFQP